MSVGVKYLGITEDLDSCPTDFNETLPCRRLSVLLQQVEVEVLQTCMAAFNQLTQDPWEMLHQAS